MRIKSKLNFCLNLLSLVGVPVAGYHAAALIWAADPFLAVVTAAVFGVFFLDILKDVVEAIAAHLEKREA